ncbi:MAG: OmpA family protein [Hyphomicrobiaceae bacterium]|nr:OmpA family protein [Hyphomicrobiaceae bacterium]
MKRPTRPRTRDCAAITALALAAPLLGGVPSAGAAEATRDAPIILAQRAADDAAEEDKRNRKDKKRGERNQRGPGNDMGGKQGMEGRRRSSQPQMDNVPPGGRAQKFEPPMQGMESPRRQRSQQVETPPPNDRKQFQPGPKAPRQDAQDGPTRHRFFDRNKDARRPPPAEATTEQPAGPGMRKGFRDGGRDQVPPPAGAAKVQPIDPGVRKGFRDGGRDQVQPPAGAAKVQPIDPGMRKGFRDDARDRTRDSAVDSPRNERNFLPERSERKRWRAERREAEKSGGWDNLKDLKKQRKERRVEGGRTIIEEPDSRRIIRSGDRAFIIRDETRRFRRGNNDAMTKRRPGGGNITTIVRPNGVRIISETAPDGRLIRRYRRGHDGRDIILIDNRRTWRKWGAIGAGAALAAGLLIAIEPPHYRGPRNRYVVDYDHASYDDVYDALIAPPIDDLDRGYTLDEVIGTYNLRERMRRIDLDSINFEFGAWQVDESQYNKLERVARAMGRIIDRNPDEVFLIEGYTDAVGDDVDNLSLSDRRAEEVANILTEEFDIPPENLVTQGYGEQFLKIDTDGPERANRRVTVRRITPLLERRVSRRFRD